MSHTKPRESTFPYPVNGSQRHNRLSYYELIETLGRTPVSRPPLYFEQPVSESPPSRPKANVNNDQQEPTTGNNEMVSEGTEAAEDVSTSKEEEKNKGTIGVNESLSIINENSRQTSSQDTAINVELNKKENSSDFRTAETTVVDVKEHDIQNDQKKVIKSKRTPPRVPPKPKPSRPIPDMSDNNKSLVPVELEMYPLNDNPKNHLISDSGSGLDSLQALQDTTFDNPVHYDELDIHLPHLKSQPSFKSFTGSLSAKSSMRSLGGLSAGPSLKSLNRTLGSSSESTLHELFDHEVIPDSYLPTAMDTCNEQILIPLPDSDMTESETDNDGGFIPEPARVAQLQNPSDTEGIDTMYPHEGVFVPEGVIVSPKPERRPSVAESEGVFVPELSPVILSPDSLPGSHSGLEHNYGSGYLSVMSSQTTLTTAPSTVDRRRKRRQRRWSIVIGLATAALLVVLTIGISLFFSVYHQSNDTNEDAIVIYDCPNDIVKYLPPHDTSMKVTWIEPTAVDQEGNNVPFLPTLYSPGVFFSEGTTPVSYIFVDYLHNEMTWCSFDIIIHPSTHSDIYSSSEFSSSDSQSSPDDPWEK